MWTGKNVCHAQTKNTLKRAYCLSFSLSLSTFVLLITPPPSPPLHLHRPFMLPSSLLIRMDPVLVGRGRRQCPSAAACQRRRSAVLQTVSTPWWVSYSVTLYIKYTLYIPVHEILNVHAARDSVRSQAFEPVKHSAEIVQK